MPSISDIAICIRRWDFSETSQTISLFARSHGVLRGIAKGAKRSKGAFSGGIDVLTRGQVVAIVGAGHLSDLHQSLATVTAWHLQHVYRAARESLAANRAALYMADLIHGMVRDHDPHPDLFDAFDAGLDQFADAEARPRTLLEFQWTLLVETGFQPELHRDAVSGAALPAKSPTLAFDAQHGGVVADDDRASGPAVWRVRRETIDLLRRTEAGRLDSTADIATIARANRLLATYLSHLIGHEPATMRWAFPDLPDSAGRSG